jgi:hypothetical protein
VTRFVLWGARPGDVQIGSIEDRLLQRDWRRFMAFGLYLRRCRETMRRANVSGTTFASEMERLKRQSGPTGVSMQKLAESFAKIGVTPLRGQLIDKMADDLRTLERGRRPPYGSLPALEVRRLNP